MSASEPETPKPDSVVAQEVTNALDNLKAENKKLTQELAQTKRQYMELLKNSAATITQRDAELATVTADRDELQSQWAAVEAENEALKQTATENTRYYAGLLNEAGANLGTLKKDLAERDAEIQQLKKDLAAVAVDRNVEKSLKKQLDSMPTENHQDYDQLLESSSTTIDNQRKVVALLQSRLRKEREEREKLEAQLAELEQNPTTASKDLPEAADLLKNLRKSNGKKSTASLADVEKILEILGGSSDSMD